MGEVEDDDFGDLYADVQLSSCVTIPSPKELLYIREEEERNLPSVESCSISNEKDSITLELEAINGEAKVAVDEELTSENESESEDDLRIVLNDEDCRGLNPINSNPINFDGGRRRLHQDEDEDMLGVEHTSAASAPAPAAEKCFGIKTNYYLQSSQYKYIRSPGEATFIAKRNGFGSAVSFPLSSIRCNSDANGFNQQAGSSTGTAFSGSIPLLLMGQSGSDFSLPRRRTIFDVNVDAFEQKPWKHPGVDITDFFNFELDEESWKHYCNSLEQYRQETTAVSRSNEGEAPETVGEEGEQIGQVGGVSHMLNDFRGKRMLNKPIGRAIQVDGGFGERRPSMDIRRHRNRDSDVVIKISVEDNMECSSNSSKGELGQSNNSKLNLSDSGGSSMDITENAFSAESVDEHEAYVKDVEIWSWKRCSQRKILSNALTVNPDGQGTEENPDVDGYHRKVQVCEENSEAAKKIEELKEDVQRNPFREDPCTPEAESSPGNHLQYTSSLSCSNSHIESHSVRIASINKDTHNPARKPLSNSVGELCEPVTLGRNQSKYLRGKHCKFELRENKEEQDFCSRLSVTETTNHVGDVVAARKFSRRDLHDGNHLTKSSRWRDWQLENDCGDWKDLPYYRETGISFGHRRERSAGKPVKDGSTNCYRGKVHTEFRNGMDPFLHSYWDEREYILQKTFTLREKEARQGEHFLPERRYTRKFYGVTRDKSHGYTPESSSFYTEKERYRWQRRNRVDEDCIRQGTEIDDFVLEHRYREQYVQDNCASPVPYYDREKEYVNESYDRNASYKSPSRRDRCGSPYRDILSDMYRDIVQDDEYRRHPVHEPLPPHRDYRITWGRGWRNTTLPRPADSRRLGGEDIDPWRQTHSEKHQNNTWYDDMYMDSDDDDIIYPFDCFRNEERGYTHQSNVLDWPEERSSRQQNQGRLYAEDRVSSRKRNQGRVYAKETSFSHEWSPRHEAGQVKEYDSSHQGKALNKKWLMHDRKRKIDDVTNISLVNARATSNFNLIDEVKDEQAALKQRKPLDLHFVGWEGKESGKQAAANGGGGGGSNAASCCWFKARKAADDEEEEEKPLLITNSNKQSGKKSNKCLSENKIEKVSEESAAIIQQQSSDEKMNDILAETMAKMVRRRERFKEPIILVAAADKIEQAQGIIETEQQQQERPKRKRRWGG